LGVENKRLSGYIWQMTTVAIDTLRYVKRLRAVGFTEEQAEVQAEALSEAVRDSLVTKADLNEGLEKLRGEIGELRAEGRETEARLRVEIRDLHTGLLRWLIPLIIGQTAVVAALVKLL
jgi:predicted  nucleic acid-binding Zn-ribbon protein